MKRAIVIGATSGIGRGLAECFAAQGYAVGLVGRRENLLKEIAQADPAAYRFAVADVTRPAETVAALSIWPKNWAAWIYAWSAPERAI